MTPNFWVHACMHTSAVTAIALRPSGACQRYQSPPQPRHGACRCRLCQPSLFQQGFVGGFAEGSGFLTSDLVGQKESGSGLSTVSNLGLIRSETGTQLGRKPERN